MAADRRPRRANRLGVCRCPIATRAVRLVTELRNGCKHPVRRCRRHVRNLVHYSHDGLRRNASEPRNFKNSNARHCWNLDRKLFRARPDGRAPQIRNQAQQHSAATRRLLSHNAGCRRRTFPAGPGWVVRAWRTRSLAIAGAGVNDAIVDMPPRLKLKASVSRLAFSNMVFLQKSCCIASRRIQLDSSTYAQ